MPQLDPSPWFAIFLFSWMVFAFVVPPKVTAHKFPNDPDYKIIETPPGMAWDWPWH
uniref:ATP synthase complex subunit 8 n=1 Tax=Grammatorcynus bilineatus TaxID=372801 RepID=A0A7G7MYW0_9SCOM|nr:ATP synthase F0 subunit 8 [Grammatorcynus bilineatus]QNG58019.1 ATP synthase F0 subunit 8 [Grammatorcynus bilineatus]